MCILCNTIGELVDLLHTPNVMSTRQETSTCTRLLKSQLHLLSLLLTEKHHWVCMSNLSRATTYTGRLIVTVTVNQVPN